MTARRRLPPAPEELPELYGDLVQRMETLQGKVAQLQSQQTAATISRPTWRDLQPIQQDFQRLKKKVGLDDE